MKWFQKPKSQFVRGVLFALFGAICFSSKAIFVKLAYRDTAVEPLTLLTLRMVFSLPFFAAMIFLFPPKEGTAKLTAKQWILIALTGSLGYYVSSLLDFKGLQYVTAAIERLVLFIYPTFVLLISVVVFKTTIKPVQWIALAITYLGLLAAFAGEAFSTGALTPEFLIGSGFIFLCAITYATYIVGSGKIIPTVGASRFNSYAMSFASLAVFLHFFLLGNESLLSLSSSSYQYGFLMAIFSTVIPSYLVTAGIKRIGSTNAAIVASIGPVSTILMAYFFLHETISSLQLLGTAAIIGGVLLIGYRGTEE